MNMNVNRTRTQIIFNIYFLLMVFIYGGYVLLFNYRMKMSEVLLSKDILTPADVATIGQLGGWSERMEILFLVTFVIICIYTFWKRKSHEALLKKFFVVNIYLTVGIVATSFILSYITPLLIMDLMLPLINVIIVLPFLIIYVIIEKFLKYSIIGNRTS